VDIAARLSWAAGTCPAAGTVIGRRGDTFRLAAQVYNQGTTALTGIGATLSVWVLAAPSGRAVVLCRCPV